MIGGLTPSPNCLGTYAENGIYDGATEWKRLDGGFYIWWDVGYGVWFLSQLGPVHDATGWYIEKAKLSVPTGTWTAFGSAVNNILVS
jgi:hypothetical protein